MDVLAFLFLFQCASHEQVLRFHFVWLEQIEQLKRPCVLAGDGDWQLTDVTPLVKPESVKEARFFTINPTLF